VCHCHFKLKIRKNPLAIQRSPGLLAGLTGSYTALPRPPSWINGKGEGGKGQERQERREKGGGEVKGEGGEG